MINYHWMFVTFIIGVIFGAEYLPDLKNRIINSIEKFLKL